jgi:hypothetical protein
MRIRLYIDEDSMSRALVRALLARNIDVTTALEENMIEQPDSAHLDFATSQGRALYSFNVGDFYRLHTTYLAQGRSHAGIIFSLQQTYSVGEQMRRLLRLAASRSAEEMCNRIEFLGSWG